MLAPQLNDRFDRRTHIPSDADLVRFFHAGQDWAATQLHARYRKRVLGLVQQNWPSSMQRRCDPEDIAQEVFTRFFRAVKRGIYSTCEETNLWGFLLVVTLNQIRKTAAQHLSGRRDIRQTVGPGACEDDAAARQAATAHSRLVVGELLESLPQNMRRAVQCRLEGFTIQEIAHDLLISHRAAERLLQSVRQRVGQFFELAPLPAPTALALLRLRKSPTGMPRRTTLPHDGSSRIKIA